MFPHVAVRKRLSTPPPWEYVGMQRYVKNIIPDKHFFIFSHSVPQISPKSDRKTTEFCLVCHCGGGGGGNNEQAGIFGGKCAFLGGFSGRDGRNVTYLKVRVTL